MKLSAVAGGHDAGHDQLQAPSFSTRCDRPCGLALLPISAEPASGGRDAAGARHCRFPRNDPLLGEEIRTGVCRPISFGDWLIPPIAVVPTIPSFPLSPVSISNPPGAWINIDVMPDSGNRPNRLAYSESVAVDGVGGRCTRMHPEWPKRFGRHDTGGDRSKTR